MIASGNTCGSNLKRANEGFGLGLGFVRYTRSISGKRIAIASNIDADSTMNMPVKKQCGEKMTQNTDKSLLEALPQDILIKVVCGVDHDDLKQLAHVSKMIREATLIAKKQHFAYSTPTKTLAFRNPIDLGDAGDIEETKAPNAPKQFRSCRSRLSAKKLAEISVALFLSPDEKEQEQEQQQQQQQKMSCSVLAQLL